MKKYTPFVLFFTVFIFTIISCDNFLQGNLLKEELDNKIAYESLDDFSIYISASNNEGVTVPSGKYEGKVGTKSELHFSASTNYSFYKWQITDSKSNYITTDAVTIEDPYSVDTTFTINSKLSDIKIIPICFLITERNKPEFQFFDIKNYNPHTFKKSEISIKNFENNEWVNEDFNKNHSSSLFINCTGSDDSGIFGIKITETLIHDYLGSTCNYVTTQTVDSFTRSNMNNWNKEFIYNFCSLDDGIVKLTFSLIDIAGNESTSKTYYFIKDTRVTKIGLSNYVFHKKLQLKSNAANDTDFIADSKTISLEDMKQYISRIVIDFDETWYKKDSYNFYESLSKMKFDLYCNNKHYQFSDLTYDNELKLYYIDINEDEKKDVQLKVEMVDTVGNQNSFNTTLYKSPDIYDYNVYYYESNGCTYSFIGDNNENARRYNIISKGDRETSYNFSYSNSIRSSVSAGSLYGRKKTSNELSYPGYIQTSRYISGSSLNKQSSNYQNDYGKFTEPQTFYISAVGENYYRDGSYTYMVGYLSESVHIDQSNPEDDFTVPSMYGELKLLDKNSGKTNLIIHFNNTSNLRNYDKVYLIASGDTVYADLNDNKISAKMNTSKINNSLFQRSNGIFVTFIKGNKKRIVTPLNTDLFDSTRCLNFTADNTQPYYDNNDYFFPDFTGQNFIIENPGDNKGFSGNPYSGTIAFIPLQNEWKISTIKNLQNDYKWNTSLLNDNYTKNFNFTKNNSLSNNEEQIFVPINDLSDGNYLVFGYVMDEAGNECFLPYSWYSSKTLKSPLITGDGTTVTITNNIENTSNYYFYLEEYDTVNKKWKSSTSTPSIIKASDGTIHMEYEKQLTVSNNIYSGSITETSKFLRVTIKETGYPTMIKTGINSSTYRNSITYTNSIYETKIFNFSSPVYFYSKVDTSKEMAKVVINGLGGFVIYHNSPCYVHTVYSDKDLGTDPEVWEKNVIHTNKVNSNYFDYSGSGTTLSAYTLNTSEIPDNSYYTTIFHFADGTSQMSDVIRK